jgi:hypothetical protein
MKICKQKIYASNTTLEKENAELTSKMKNILMKNTMLKKQIKNLSEFENKVKELQCEITLLKSTIHELEMKNREYEIEHKYINESKEEYKELLGKVNTTINNSYSNTSNITLKQIVSKLEPISYDDIKNSMSQLTNEYIDEGIKGFAKFLCDHGCNNKIITTDSSRSTIAYRTAYDDFIRDPECLNLINNTLQKNSDEIIKKTNERKDYYRSLMDTNIDTQEYISISNRASKIFELKKLTESSIRENPDENIKKISNILVNHGLTTYHKISNTVST